MDNWIESLINRVRFLESLYMILIERPTRLEVETMFWYLLFKSKIEDKLLEARLRCPSR